MEYAQQPPKIPSVFASTAPFGNVTNPIPNTPQTGGFVSWPTGFQDINFTQQAAGGIPPWGRDFNGLFQIFSAWIQWFQAGGAPPKFDQQFANEVGGYPQGAFLQNAVTIGSFWINQQDNNTSNPDEGGANWMAFPPAFQVPQAAPPIEIFPELPPPPPPTILPPQETLINNIQLQEFLTVQNFTNPGPSNGRLINVRMFNVPGNYYYLPSNAPCSAVDIIMQGGGGAGGGCNAPPGQQAAGCAGGAGGILRWYGPTAYVAGQLMQVASGGQGTAGGAGGGGGTTAIPAIQTYAYGGGGCVPGINADLGMPWYIEGDLGGDASGGNIFNIRGAKGTGSMLWPPPDNAMIAGNGGNNYFGGGGGKGMGSGGIYGYPESWNGESGELGGGGGGATSKNGAGAFAGGNGGNGFIMISEYS